jgi:hypothetical protein
VTTSDNGSGLWLYAKNGGEVFPNCYKNGPPTEGWLYVPHTLFCTASKGKRLA